MEESLEFPESGWFLLCFPESGGSLESLEMKFSEKPHAFSELIGRFSGPSRPFGG